MIATKIESKLQKIAHNRGIKQKWIAEKIGKSENTVSLIFTGRHIPSYADMCKIAHLLNSTVAELWPATVETVDA